jgi:succinate-acetate transporter protein
LSYEDGKRGKTAILYGIMTFLVFEFLMRGVSRAIRIVFSLKYLLFFVPGVGDLTIDKGS